MIFSNKTILYIDQNHYTRSFFNGFLVYCCYSCFHVKIFIRSNKSKLPFQNTTSPPVITNSSVIMAWKISTECHQLWSPRCNHMNPYLKMIMNLWSRKVFYSAILKYFEVLIICKKYSMEFFFIPFFTLLTWTEDIE